MSVEPNAERLTGPPCSLPSLSPRAYECIAATFGCLELSAVLFAGSLLTLLAPDLWWADAAAAIGLGALIGREGIQTVRAARKPAFTGGCGCGH